MKTFTYILNRINHCLKVITLNEIIHFSSSTIFISFALEYDYTHEKYDSVTKIYDEDEKGDPAIHKYNKRSTA